MIIRTRLAALLALAALGAVAPAWAQTAPAMPDDANKALWCSTAFSLVAPQAKAQGQTAAADRFTKYSATLATTGHDSMIKAGFTEDQAKAQTAAYTDKVTKELSGGGQADFTVVECTMLVDPQAAAALQQATPPAADATAPATGGDAAPAAGDAAPATPAPSDSTTPAPSK